MKNAKEKSRTYFNAHRKSGLAHGGYWRHDYRCQLEAVGRIRPDTLIDIGCGTGAFLCRTAESYPTIRLGALDLSKEMIRETEERLGGNAEAVVGDAEHMPVKDETYQAVTCNMSIHHYPHPQRAVNEMYRILQQGGYLLLNDMDCIASVRWIANLVFPKLPGGDVKMYDRTEIETMIRQAGFKWMEYRKISPFSFQCIAEK